MKFDGRTRPLVLNIVPGVSRSHLNDRVAGVKGGPGTIGKLEDSLARENNRVICI